MNNEIEAKSMLRKHKHIDSWFLSSYAINLYRGCSHSCVYCDGRNEKYRVEGNFGQSISVKTNAIDLLKKELDPSRKRKPFNNGFMVICGGVSDSYQPCELKYGLCGQTLELLNKYNHPVHILTKSALVERDIDLLQEINQRKKAVVSFSFSSTDERLSRLLEPGAASPENRLKVIQKIKDAGITCGMFLMPVVPYITDTFETLKDSVRTAADAGIDFIIFGSMTLKAGVQKTYFDNFLQKHFPELIGPYKKIYDDKDQWGSPDYGYFKKIEDTFCEIADTFKMPKRMPSHIFKSLVSKKELIVLILKQLDYLVKMRGKKSPYGFAAHKLEKYDKPIGEYNYNDLIKIQGIGNVTANIILEIVKEGRCDYYEKML